jgi:uncharacterized protein
VADRRDRILAAVQWNESFVSVRSVSLSLSPFLTHTSITLFEIALAIAALIGHAVVWVGLNNRIHATSLKRSHLKPISALVHFGTVAVPVAFAWWIFREQPSLGRWLQVVEQRPTLLFYVLFCAGMALVHLPRWFYVRFVILRKATSHGRRLTLLDVHKRLGRWPTKGWKFAVGRWVPFNEVMQVEFVEKKVRIANLPPELDGMRIVHLSDLHLSGRVEPAFFVEVMRVVNELNADLILLTGDVFDYAKCLPWIDEVLSPLRARHGKFFILGNHDDRLADVAAARAAISATGFVDLGGRWDQLTVNGLPLALGGNELPWFGPPSDDENPAEAPAKPFKILLSHSPDQVSWAQKRGYDLMLCGHTHGGQIRFPVIGPVVCPSWYGVRYAGGLFLEESLALHVSRGISGLFPIRWNCRPEVALLVLRSENQHGRQNRLPLLNLDADSAGSK